MLIIHECIHSDVERRRQRKYPPRDAREHCLNSKTNEHPCRQSKERLLEPAMLHHFTMSRCSFLEKILNITEPFSVDKQMIEIKRDTADNCCRKLGSRESQCLTKKQRRGEMRSEKHTRRFYARLAEKLLSRLIFVSPNAFSFPHHPENRQKKGNAEDQKRASQTKQVGDNSAKNRAENKADVLR